MKMYSEMQKKRANTPEAAEEEEEEAAVAEQQEEEASAYSMSDAESESPASAVSKKGDDEDLNDLDE